MTPPPRRRLRAAALSAAVVLAPTGAGTASAWVAVDAGREALVTADAAGLLLAIACLGLAGVLAWAGAAAAAGVVDAWRSASPVTGGSGSVGMAPAGRPSSRPRPVPAAPSRGRGGLVSAGVAALVVAALTAPGAAASAAAPGAAVVVAEQVDEAPSPPPPPSPSVPEDGDGADTADGAKAAASEPGEARPGSWSALAEEGFRAPRGASVGAAALVTAQPSRGVVAGTTADVVVLAGDSLWSIAERHLGPGADATEVAAAWPRWWEANRAVVGDDPHLLLPGQRLVAPAP